MKQITKRQQLWSSINYSLVSNAFFSHIYIFSKLIHLSPLILLTITVSSALIDILSLSHNTWSLPIRHSYHLRPWCPIPNHFFKLIRHLDLNSYSWSRAFLCIRVCVVSADTLRVLTHVGRVRRGFRGGQEVWGTLAWRPVNLWIQMKGGICLTTWQTIIWSMIQSQYILFSRRTCF